MVNLKLLIDWILETKLRIVVASIAGAMILGSIFGSIGNIIN